MKKIIINFFTLLSLLCIMHIAYADVIKAQVDRDTITIGETVNLMITMNNERMAANPNLAQVDKEFEILSHAQQNQISIVNGQSSAVTMWYIALTPRRTGTLTIPAIKIGNSYTNSVTVNVLPLQEVKQQQALEDVFIKTKIEPSTPYIQGQAIYTVQLYYNKNIQNAQLTDPTFDSGRVIQIGKDRSFQKSINGTLYQIVERRFAIIPEKSGSLTIGAPILSGSVLLREQLTNNDLTYFNSAWQPIKVSAKPTTLDVKPIPNNIAADQWLPAEQLTLTQKWSSPPTQFQVGQPITRTLTLDAFGLTGEQLPEITLPQLSDLQIYPDKPVMETKSDGKTLLAKKVISIALIPTQSGELTLPPITIPWWNTQTNSLEQATIPAQTLTIAAAPGETKSENVATPPPAEPAVVAAKTPPAVNTVTEQTTSKNLHDSVWLITTIILLLCWLVTLILFYRARRTNSSNSNSMPGMEKQAHILEARKQCKEACFNNQPEQCKTALITWARCVWPHNDIRNLGDVQRMMKGAEIKHELREFDKCFYTNQLNNWDGKKLWQLLEKEMITGKKAHAKTGGLPKLYPED